MKVNKKLCEPKNIKTARKNNKINEALNGNSRESTRPSTDFGPKRIVQCHTCKYIYNRTSRRESKLHTANHHEYLKEQ